MALEVIILAAGQGTRMRSSLPKVLHPLAGKPMVGHVVDTASQLDPSQIHVVIGHGAEQLVTYLDGRSVNLVNQLEQLGTGHAVDQAMPAVDADSTVLILYGDVPLVQLETLKTMVSLAEQQLALLTVELKDATGYGRIVRGSTGQVTAIVEQKDAMPEQLDIREINTGILALPASWLKRWLPELSSNNAQGEYYLTDIIAMAAQECLTITAIHPESEEEVQGVNNRMQLAALERWYQQRQAWHWMASGVTLLDPDRVDFRGELDLAEDVTLDINVVLEGRVKIGQGVTIGANCIIKNSEIAAGAIIKPHSMIEESQVAAYCEVGPYARLRPGTVLREGAKVGNFVETKKTTIGAGSKVNHLSYVGDTEIGRGANIGAGTITCNYDGVNKHRTIIGDGAFIGSNSALVAPIEVGANATVAAGSTVTKSVQPGELAVSRGKQMAISGWKRPVKKQSS